MAANVSDLAERVAKEMHLHNHDQASSSARGRSQSFPLYSPHSFMNNSSPLPASRALQDHAEEVATCETSLPGRLSPGAEYLKAIGNVRLISHQHVMSEDSTGWTDPWDYPISPIYDTVTGKLIGAADIPRKVPYWVTDSEIYESPIQKQDNDSWSFMTHSNTHSGNQSDVDTESLDPSGIPKAHHWQSERAKPAAKLPNPPTHKECGYIPPELRDGYDAACRKNNRLSRNQLNRFYEIIDGHRKKYADRQIGRDAAKQHENWRKAQVGVEQRIDNRKPLSPRAAHLIDPMDRRAPTTSGWQQASTPRIIPVSQDSRYYARMSSPINPRDYFAPDVPTRYVTPTQEDFSGSRFVKPSRKRFSDSQFAKPSQKLISDSRFVTPSQTQISDSRFVTPTQDHFSDSGFVTPSQKRTSDSRFAKPSQKHISDPGSVMPSQKQTSDRRFVMSSQEHCSDSRFLPANFVNHHAQRGHTRKNYNSSGRHGRRRSVKPSYNDAMMHHHPSSPTMHQNSGRNPANYIQGAANSVNSRIERKPLPALPALPASNVYRYYPHTASYDSCGNGRESYHGLDAVNHSFCSDQYYRNNYERPSPRTLRRSTNYDNLRGLPIRTIPMNSTNKF